MNPAIQIATKLGSKISPQFLQALSSRQNLMKMIERGKTMGSNSNTIKQLEKAWNILSQKMGGLK